MTTKYEYYLNTNYYNDRDYRERVGNAAVLNEVGDDDWTPIKRYMTKAGPFLLYRRELRKPK